MNTKSKVIAALVLLLAVFLLGFVPQYTDKRRVQAELRTLQERLSVAERQNEIDRMRQLAGQMLLEASRLNYGNTREYSTQYFDRLRKLADTSQDPSSKASLSELLSTEDSISKDLAEGSPSVLPKLQTLLERTNSLPNPAVNQND
jgi:hypothetical protein